jgi:hypothetical protein
MSTLKRQRLQRGLFACLRAKKSMDGEFSAKELRLAGTPVSAATLRQLCEAGCLEFRANGTKERGTRWYRVARSSLPYWKEN